jgi:hypothetical protein
MYKLLLTKVAVLLVSGKTKEDVTVSREQIRIVLNDLQSKRSFASLSVRSSPEQGGCGVAMGKSVST